MADKELVNTWFKYAKSDLDVAKYLFDTMYPKPLSQICFLCQQAAEKYIKGVMIYFGDEIIKTHDLVRLQDMLSTKIDTDIIISGCVALTPYAVRLRYPNESFVDENQAKIALDYALRFKDWAEGVIKE